MSIITIIVGCVCSVISCIATIIFIDRRSITGHFMIDEVEQTIKAIIDADDRKKFKKAKRVVLYKLKSHE